MELSRISHLTRQILNILYDHHHVSVILQDKCVSATRLASYFPRCYFSLQLIAFTTYTSLGCSSPWGPRVSTLILGRSPHTEWFRGWIEKHYYPLRRPLCWAQMDRFRPWFVLRFLSFVIGPTIYLHQVHLCHCVPSLYLLRNSHISFSLGLIGANISTDWRTMSSSHSV